MGLRVLPALLYGKGHSYGNPLTGSGTEESVAKLTREDLVKFHQTWFRPNNGTLVVVGDTTMAEITPKLEKLFAGWPKREMFRPRTSAACNFRPSPWCTLWTGPGRCSRTSWLAR